jgi:hypothetical protein
MKGSFELENEFTIIQFFIQSVTNYSAKQNKNVGYKGLFCKRSDKKGALKGK